MQKIGVAIHPNMYVAGAALRGSGYPNAENTLRILEGEHGIEVADLACWLPEDFHLWQLSKGHLLTRLCSLFRLLVATFTSFIRLRRRVSSKDIVYIPYPSLFFLWVFSFTRRERRPSLISDSYIYIWDTMFRDRYPAGGGGYLSRLLFKIEARALRTADVLIVDTLANAADLAEIYKGIRPPVACPLALPLVQRTQDLKTPFLHPSKINVLFVGTLIPLHGVEIIIAAAQHLAGRSDIHITIVGKGQLSQVLEGFMESKPGNVTWKSDWMDALEMQRYIDQADFCLGIFSGNEKSRRVFPFKLYWYLSRGKAVINQDVFSLPENCPPPPLTGVKPGCAKSLASAIEKLADNSSLRVDLGQQSKKYYDSFLSDKAIASFWGNLLSGFESNS